MAARLSFGPTVHVESAPVSQPLEWSAMQQAATILTSLEPHTVVDYSVLWIIACCINGMPRQFENWQIPISSIITRLQTLVPTSMRPSTEQALNPRVAGVLKLFAAACLVVGIRMGYTTDSQRRKILTFYRSAPSDNTPSRVVALIRDILAHLKDRRPLPHGMTWHIKSGRQERRLKSKAASRLQKQYFDNRGGTGPTSPVENGYQ